MAATARKIFMAIAALALGGAPGYATGSLIDEETIVTAIKWPVIVGMVLVAGDAIRRAWRWWRKQGTF
jgi:hypothetical protein